MADGDKDALERSLFKAAVLDAAGLESRTGPGSGGRSSGHFGARSGEHWAGGLNTPPSDSFPGYEITGTISRGGQGLVYQALHKPTKRRVAIKVLRDGPFSSSRDRARFEREVQILSRLNHPNIVAIHDSGNVGEWAYHVMDYISGQALDTHMAGRLMSIDQTLQLFVKICTAVNAAHLRGVIHRDLKPSNIRVDAAGEPHILDFGLAKVGTADATDDSHPQMMTITGQFVGSLPWASPEQAEGVPDKIDIRTDVYSLGVILYQMLTDRFPYEVIGNIRDVLANIQHVAPALPSGIRRQINDEVETIVLKCLSKERERRYQSAGELARDIEHYLAGEPIEAKRDSGWYVLTKTLQRYRGRAATAAAFVVLLAASAVALGILYQRATSQAALARQQQGRAEREATQSKAIAEVLGSVMEIADPGSGGFEDPLPKLDRAAGMVDQEFADQPIEQARLRYALGIGYSWAGWSDYRRAFDGAVKQANAALSIRRRELGADHLDTLRTMGLLIYLRANSQEFGEAERLAREMLSLSRSANGSSHTFREIGLQVLNKLCYQKHQFAEALASAREAAAVGRAEHGPLDPRTTVLQRDLAMALCATNAFDEAESLAQGWLKEAEDAGEQGLNARIQGLGILSMVYSAAGKTDRAAELNAQRAKLLVDNPPTQLLKSASQTKERGPAGAPGESEHSGESSDSGDSGDSGGSGGSASKPGGAGEK